MTAPAWFDDINKLVASINSDNLPSVEKHSKIKSMIAILNSQPPYQVDHYFRKNPADQQFYFSDSDVIYHRLLMNSMDLYERLKFFQENSLNEYFYHNLKFGYYRLSDFIHQIFPRESPKTHTKRLTYYRKNKIYDKQTLFTVEAGLGQCWIPTDVYDPLSRWGEGHLGTCKVWNVKLSIPDEYKHPVYPNVWHVSYFDKVREILSY